MWGREPGCGGRSSSYLYRVHSELVSLYLALVFFSIALFFWVGCIWSADHQVRVLVFWYAVVFENAGYIMLITDRVTNG